MHPHARDTWQFHCGAHACMCVITYVRMCPAFGWGAKVNNFFFTIVDSGH